MKYFKRIKSKNQHALELEVVWYLKTEEVVHMIKEKNNYVNVVSIKYFSDAGNPISAPPSTEYMEWKEISAAEFATYML